MPLNTQQKSTTTTKTFSAASAALAFSLWGLWAFYSNQNSEAASAVLSGVAQGTFSALVTLIMVRVVTAIYVRFASTRFAILIPAVTTVSCSSVCLVLLHSMIGTSSIIKTITPPLTVAFVFCVLTAYKLQQAEAYHE